MGKRILVKGLVQGVGFRPFVWRLARELKVSGHVFNDGAGVQIEAHAPTAALDAFVGRLNAECPTLARIDLIDVSPCENKKPPVDFRIIHSEDGHVSAGVVPDAATCPACHAEIIDPENRRYRHPFSNCTHCGPRLSILRHIPYDRTSTTMSVFPMCAACRSEYENPADCRFHAQPIACPDCGPELWFENAEQSVVQVAPIRTAATKLKAGKILAIKGLGGFQIAVDAGNETAIAELRKRKHRPDKPLALMARDLDQIRNYCRLNSDEEALLAGPAAPILILQKSGQSLAQNIASGHDSLGFMLPSTPLHHLLMAELERPIVLTSGNLSDNPQETKNEEARRQLAGIVDGFLMHDREINNRLDDSVMRSDRTGPAVLRRARGLAPASIRLSPRFADAPKVLAMGGELKSSFCLLNGQDAVLSQHIGDLENAKTFADYKKMLQLYLELYQFEPDVIAVDCHPQYLSTVHGEHLAQERGADLVRVQHHHAHMSACLAEHSDFSDSCETAHGIILDGLGWGDDDTVWGGELLKGGFSGFERMGCFKPVLLPGGSAAIREPWRNLAAHLFDAFGPNYRDRLDGTQLPKAFAAMSVTGLEDMMMKRVNSPRSSSAGRLFDAVAAALGICFHRQSFEGQAAMLLESLARTQMKTQSAYPVTVSLQPDVLVSFDEMWLELIADLKNNVPVDQIAARFHLGLIEGLAKTIRLSGARPPETVVLSGGVFQNAILRDRVSRKLQTEGHNVLNHHIAPANDGGLALGQAVIAAAKGMGIQSVRV
ncbi:MAG: carbamoyltransferase HypF [Roseibium sp.]|uniref:carbamoyltransferase HypF n=1 Tax=Roseibium sp. TaxID=1936156 RepID=UPI0026179E42|nr:carbamoyltransferase HypF [Roseibium sp.]MCV0425523.1 carbamoyltransferase HypF [Roseibium sp.]